MPRDSVPDRNVAVAMVGLGLDGLVLLACAIKVDIDLLGYAVAGIVFGWITGILAITLYKTRKLHKKLTLFLTLHLSPIAATLYMATHG